MSWTSSSIDILGVVRGGRFIRKDYLLGIIRI